MPVDRESLLGFPSVKCADFSLQVRRNFLPRIEALVARRFGGRGGLGGPAGIHFGRFSFARKEASSFETREEFHSNACGNQGGRPACDISCQIVMSLARVPRPAPP